MDPQLVYTLNLKLMLPYAILIPTYLLYLVILYVMFISKCKTQFHGPFYKLFGISAVLNVICSIIYNLQVKFPQTPAFISFVHSWGSRSFFVTFLQSSIWYLYNTAHLLNFFISFNRFTVFVLKTHYMSFWKQWLPIIVAVCFTVPCFLSWHVPFTDIYLKPKNASDPNGLWNFATGNPDIIPWMNASRYTVFLLTGTASISLLFNIYVITQLFRDKFMAIKNTQKRISKQDIKLSLYAMVVFTSDMVYCVQQYIRRTSSDQTFIDIMYDIQNAVADVTCIAPVVFMLIANTTLRRNIIALILGKNPEVSVISAVKPFNSNPAPQTVSTGIHHR